MIKVSHLRRMVFILFFIVLGVIFGAFYSQSKTLYQMEQWLGKSALPSIGTNIKPYWLTNPSVQTQKIFEALSENFSLSVIDQVGENSILSTLKIQSIGNYEINSNNNINPSLSYRMTLGSQQVPVVFSYIKPSVWDSLPALLYFSPLIIILALIFIFWPSPLSAFELEVREILRGSNVPENSIKTLQKDHIFGLINIELFKKMVSIKAISWQDAIRISSTQADSCGFYEELLNKGIHIFDAEKIVAKGCIESVDLQWFLLLRNEHEFEFEDAYFWSKNSHSLEINNQENIVNFAGVEVKLKPKEHAILVTIINRLLDNKGPIQLPKIDCPDVSLGQEIAEIYELLKGMASGTLASLSRGIENEELTQSISKLRKLTKQAIKSADLSERFIIQSDKENKDVFYKLNIHPDNINIS